MAMTSLTSTERRLPAISDDALVALEGAGVLDAFRTLPRADQIRYGKWIEDGRGAKVRRDRVRSLVRIVRISHKAR